VFAAVSSSIVVPVGTVANTVSGSPGPQRGGGAAD
jgi:hypothetical protein